MKFKIGRLIVPRGSVKVMLIVDSVVYKGEEYALAEEYFYKGDNKSYRICRWDSHEHVVRIVREPELLTNLTAELRKRNPDCVPDDWAQKDEGSVAEKKENRFTSTFIGLTDILKNKVSDCSPEVETLMNAVSRLDSFKNFETDAGGKKLLREILASIFFIHITLLDLLEKPDFSILDSVSSAGLAISLLKRLNTESYTDIFLRKIITEVSGFCEVFPLITETAKNQDYSRFSVAHRYICGELQYCAALTIKDALDYNDGREIMAIMDILDECREIDSRLKSEYSRESLEEFIRKYNPSEVTKYLDCRIIGQREAKRAAALTFYRHVIIQAHPDKGIKKENLMVYGPSGCGKTEIFRALKEISPVPLYICSAAEITGNGYVGTSFNELIISLSTSDEDISRSIIVLDEGDKLFMPDFDSSGQNINKSIQGDLLKAIEGTVISGKSRRINTENITFIFVGAFTDLYEKRLQHHKKIGFGTGTAVSSDNDIYFGVNDFIKFGMIPELARRISVYAPVHRLTCSDYRKIFTDINSGILDEVSRFLSINNILLKIDSPDETADSLAEEAENLGLGASGLRSIFSQAVNERFFDAADTSNGQQIIRIGKDDIHDAARHFADGFRK